MISIQTQSSDRSSTTREQHGLTVVGLFLLRTSHEFTCYLSSWSPPTAEIVVIHRRVSHSLIILRPTRRFRWTGFISFCVRNLICGSRPRRFLTNQNSKRVGGIWKRTGSPWNWTRELVLLILPLCYGEALPNII